jgi:hypothetical protein
MPGVNEIDKLGMSHSEGSSHRAAEAKAKAIQTYARKAQGEIMSIASKRQAALAHELFDRERKFEEIGYMIKAAENDEWDSE